MDRIKKWWQAYLKKESAFGHLSNIIFFLFVILMLIPSSRKVVSQYIIKLTLFDRGRIEKIDEAKKLSNEDKMMLLYHEGEAMALNQFDGEVILINFWATWCPPCIAEMPNFQSLYTDYKDEVTFIFASTDDLEKLEKFMKDKNYDLPIYQYQYLPEPMHHSSIPTTLVIDREGQIVFEHVGAYKWDSESVRGFLDSLIDE